MYTAFLYFGWLFSNQSSNLNNHE